MRLILIGLLIWLAILFPWLWIVYAILILATLINRQV